jgi:hypothetical protein
MMSLMAAQFSALRVAAPAGTTQVGVLLGTKLHELARLVTEDKDIAALAPEARDIAAQFLQRGG